MCGSSMNVTVVLLLFFSMFAFAVYIQAFISVLKYRHNKSTLPFG